MVHGKSGIGKAWMAVASVTLSAVLGVAVGPASAVARTAMTTTGRTSQPIGHYEFCKSNPGECSIRPKDLAPIKLTPVAWKSITGVNRRVNKSVEPMTDKMIFGKDEVWAYPDKGVGDCEDYVLEKRRQLSQMGFSLANLLITVVRKPDDEGHAVLTVRTDKGDYILDNLTDRVELWSDRAYRYVKRQAIRDTGYWVGIRSGDNTLVGSIK